MPARTDSHHHAVRETWRMPQHRANRLVETHEIGNGAQLILSAFGPGESVAFKHTEVEDTFGLGFHLLGGTNFCLDGARYKTQAKEVWTGAGPCGSMSEFSLPEHGFQTVSIRFGADRAEAFFAEAVGLPAAARVVLKRSREAAAMVPLRPMTTQAAARLASMFTTPYVGVSRRLYLESCVLDLLAEQLSREPARAGCRDLLLTRHRRIAHAAKDHLDSHLQNPPTIAELARTVGSNEFTLKRAFKGSFGTTIFGYVSQRRMDYAKTLLRQGQSVSLVAHNVGYRCVRSFSNAFRRQTGCSPSSVRQSGP